jgi:uncharacterized protein (TIGR03000 family)
MSRKPLFIAAATALTIAGFFTSGGMVSANDPRGVASPADASSVAKPVFFTLRVPADAQIWFEGGKTAQGGTVRHFVSPALNPGREYVYHLHARWGKGNETVDITRAIPVRSGDRFDLDARSLKAKARRLEPANGRYYVDTTANETGTREATPSGTVIYERSYSLSGTGGYVAAPGLSDYRTSDNYQYDRR